MKRLFLSLIFLFAFCSNVLAITTIAFNTPDDVTVANLESNRVTHTNAINSADGALIQAGTIVCSKLDANSCPENRWNESFNDYVFTGLTTPTSATLASTTASGTAYVNGVRVVKDATAKTYTASKHTYVDVSSTGTFTYSEVAINATEPSVAANSIRLSRVSTDSTKVLAVRDDRVTTITLAAGTVSSMADTDADTKVQLEESTDEDIIRFDIGNAKLTTAAEVVTIEAVSADTIAGLIPTTDNLFDLGTATKEMRNLFVDGVAYIDTLVADSANISAGNVTGLVGFGMGTVTNINDILDQDDMANDSNRALATQQSIKKYVDDTGVTLLSTTTLTGVSNSGNIAITKGKRYEIWINLNVLATGDSVIWLRFDSDTGTSDYAWNNETVAFSTTPSEALTGDDADAQIVLGNMDSGGDLFSCVLHLDAETIVGGGDDGIFVSGTCHGHTTAEVNNFTHITAVYLDADTDLTDFEILTDNGNNVTGKVYLYEK